MLLMQVPAIEHNEASAIKRETVSELVRRHLRDPNHSTTEEELRNAMLETGEPKIIHEELAAFPRY